LVPPLAERSYGDSVEGDRLVGVACLTAGFVENPAADDYTVVVQSDLAVLEV
jgi:hypothetical protein